jgi:hypothetical protein
MVKVLRIRLTDYREKLIQDAAAIMQDRGVPHKHSDGEINDTAVVEYALAQLVNEARKRNDKP